MEWTKERVQGQGAVTYTHHLWKHSLQTRIRMRSSDQSLSGYDHETRHVQYLHQNQRREERDREERGKGGGGKGYKFI